MAKHTPIRVEDPTLNWLNTSRTVNSRLWFVNNRELEDHCLGYLGKYAEKHELVLYAFAWQGNHHHSVARFPGSNRAAFFQDFNARCAEGLRYYVPEYEGGPVFAREYSTEALPSDASVEKYFFYCALNAVSAGLVEYPEQYPAYNSFWDAINERVKLVRVFNRAKYNEARRSNPKVRKKDFYSEYLLKFQRLPGYEHLSSKEYKKLMLKKLEEHRQTIVASLLAKGHRFPPPLVLFEAVPGSSPKNTKTSKRYDYRPLVLSPDLHEKRVFKDWYFPSRYEPYKIASYLYRNGDDTVVFPPGTYKPPKCCRKPRPDEAFRAVA
jgi:hypothetical protein